MKSRVNPFGSLGCCSCRVCVCVLVSGVLFSVGVCVCDLLIFVLCRVGQEGKEEESGDHNCGCEGTEDACNMYIYIYIYIYIHIYRHR